MDPTFDKTHDTSLFPLCSDNASNGNNLEEEIDLAFLTNEVIKASEALVNWYNNKIIYRRRWARVLRFLMILSAGIATLIPLLAEVIKINNVPLISPGFSAVFIAFSGIIFAMEKYFGHANAWIRFVKAKLELESKIKQLKLQWLEVNLQQQMDKYDDVQTWLTILKNHQLAVTSIVETETDTWIQEFQSVIKDVPTVQQQTQTTIQHNPKKSLP